MARISAEPTSGTRLILAFLGPSGTYSHQVSPGCLAHRSRFLTHNLQAAYDRFAETVHYRTQDTISGR